MMARRARFLVLPGLILAGLTALGWAGSSILLRRRTPDPADPPSHYDLAYQPVTFPARDGIPLDGWWISAPQPNGRTLMLVPGHNGSRDGDTGQAAALARAGFDVLLFDLRAHGTSGGEQVTFGAREYLDVLGALDWLQAEKGIQRVGLVGFSMGAGIALRVAAEDSRVVAVVADGTIARVIDGLIGLGRSKGIPAPLMIGPAWVILLMASLRARAWISAADPIRWAGRVRCPVLFVHGTEDPFNTVDGVGQLAARTPHGQLWIVPGAGHRDAYRRDPEGYYGRIVDFLKESL
jgi:pimeloyl-ACP methyl ester carboxylesterase